ncbi:AAA family ATPase [Streptomyces luteogriseus]|uniref:AAA family ATPase n=1 Tax=Streptomyces luteogriseus TaxID=68233 RepID=UPI0037A01558
MSFWSELGFGSNPYVVKPLPSSAAGRELLVGRDTELRALLRRIEEGDTHVVLEGPNGVGKTSLVAVAAWVATERFLERKTPQLYLSLPEPLQIKEDASEFVSDCYFAIARAFLENEEILKRVDRKVPRTKDIKAWLEAPVLKGRGFNLSSPFGGGGMAGNSAANSSPGFSNAGFRAIIRTWLRDAFPEGTGGLVGVIDNLELLETSNAARRLLEEIRDPVLQLSGMRWVLCGARGIARSVAATPRLNGVLSDPIEIIPVADEHISNLIDTRLRHYSVRSTSKAPVSAASFEHVYEVAHNNLRDSLRHAQSFSQDNESDFFLSRSEGEIAEAFTKWIENLAIKHEASAKLQPRTRKLLEDLAAFGGTCSPSDFEQFGFNDRAHMRKNVVELERYSLVISSKDDDDQRRRSIEITSKGWLVHYARSQGLSAPPIPGL